MLCGCAKNPAFRQNLFVFSKYSSSYCELYIPKIQNSREIYPYVLSKYCSYCVNIWKIPKFQWDLFVRYQNIPPHTWTYQSSWVLVKFILMFHQNIAANVWMYEKFQNSSEIYPYIIKIFQLIVLFQWQKWNFISQSAIYIWYVLETWDMVIIWAKNLPSACLM